MINLNTVKLIVVFGILSMLGFMIDGIVEGIMMQRGPGPIAFIFLALTGCAAAAMIAVMVLMIRRDRE